VQFAQLLWRKTDEVAWYRFAAPFVVLHRPCHVVEGTPCATNAARTQSGEEAMAQPCSELFHLKVLDAGGLVLGEVETVLVDPATWKVSALRMKVRREMSDQVGVDRGLFGRPTIDVPCRLVQSVGDAVLLHTSAAHLLDALADNAPRTLVSA
jgi:sporulation protein YlmC with PRC-barrel domain